MDDPDAAYRIAPGGRSLDPYCISRLRVLSVADKATDPQVLAITATDVLTGQLAKLVAPLAVVSADEHLRRAGADR